MREADAGSVSPHDLSVAERITRLEGDIGAVHKDFDEMKTDIAAILVLQKEGKAHDDFLCHVWSALLFFIKYVLTPGVPLAFAYLMAKELI